MNDNNRTAPTIGKAWVAVPFAALVIGLTIACISKPAPKPASAVPYNGSLKAASMRTVVPVVAHPAVALVVDKTADKKEKPSANKLLTYRSRDYGVSFQYPWQYTITGARAIANSDLSLHPVSDGYAGQVTLARVDIPHGYYADTDFESGYFMLSLNQNVDQQECESQLGLAKDKDGKVLTETINGVDFRWRETDTGGHGQSAKVRQYVTFANDACYEVEMGVKTSNADGLAREVDPDQVLRRLDTMLRTVKVQPDEKPAAEVKTSTAVVPATPQK